MVGTNSTFPSVKGGMGKKYLGQPAMVVSRKFRVTTRVHRSRRNQDVSRISFPKNINRDLNLTNSVFVTHKLI